MHKNNVRTERKQILKVGLDARDVDAIQIHRDRAWLVFNAMGEKPYSRAALEVQMHS